MDRYVYITGKEIPELRWKYGIIKKERVAVTTPAGASILTPEITVACDGEERTVYGYQISWKPV